MQSPRHHSTQYPITPLPHHHVYHTGDLARWLANGNIEFLGRVDRQVKIRGVRIELGEIESQLLKHPDIKDVVVLAKTDPRGAYGSDLYLCAYIVSTDQLSLDQVHRFLLKSLPAYLLPTHMMRLERLPLTSTGKVDKKALPEPTTKTAPPYIPPGNKIEEKLLDIWSNVLSKDKHQASQLRESIGIDDNFFHRGGYSLKAVRVMAEIYNYFNVKMTLLEFFQVPSIRALAKHIRETVQRIDKAIVLKPIEKKEYYVLSPAQQRFFILSQLDPSGALYHMYDVFILGEKTDKEKLTNTFRKLIARHESLRTSFIVVDNIPVQQIPAEVDFSIAYRDFTAAYQASDINSKEKLLQKTIREFLQPFDLSRAPLLRVELVKLAQEKYLFLLDMHHIVSDAISFGIFVDEFMMLYAGNDGSLSKLTHQYKDYSEWQQQLEKTGEIKRQEEYWLKEFSHPIPNPDIPMDYQRPPRQSFEGDDITFEIPSGELTALKEYAREEATMFILLLSLFTILLAKLSGQEDIVLGTPTAGRGYVELFNIIGVFVNTLVLRNYPRENKTFDQFLEEVKKRTLEAFDNQDYQFDDLVKQVAVTRDSQRNPIFDILYSYRVENLQPPSEETHFLNLERYNFWGHEIMLDLVFTVTELEESQQFLFNIGYCTKLFKQETIEKYILYFKEIISAVVENKHILLKDIKISHTLETAQTDIPQITFGF